jgi:RHS repeat-associated protein
VDNLTYGTGSAYTAIGFRNLSGTVSGSYVYDMNGSLTTDPYKSLNIGYNVLSRTDKITVTSATGRYMDYTYDGGGQLVRKRQYDNNVLQTTTDYIDGLVYINGALSYFPMPEGRIRNIGSGVLKAEYIITDQQGNARISLEESGTAPGTAVVRQENSYYGFGLVMPGSPVSLPTADNKQLYNGGSEWQNDFNNLPDYYQTFYRNYDAALGRFIGVDPQGEATESLSPYHYAGNNPISFNDPMGNVPVFSDPNRYYRNLVPQDPGNPSSNSFGAFVANDPNNTYGPDLLKDAQNRVPYAVYVYAQLYGANIYNKGANSPLTLDQLTNGSFSIGTNGVTAYYNEPYIRYDNQDRAAMAGSFHGSYTVGVELQSVFTSYASANEPSFEKDPWYGNFLGPGPDGILANPYDLRRYGKVLQPIDALDAAAQRHDYAYWVAKASGIKGAAFNLAVTNADARLTQDARNILISASLGGIDPISNRSYSFAELKWAIGVSHLFGIITTYKAAAEVINYDVNFYGGILNK